MFFNRSSESRQSKSNWFYWEYFVPFKLTQLPIWKAFSPAVDIFLHLLSTVRQVTLSVANSSDVFMQITSTCYCEHSSEEMEKQKLM